MLPGENQLGKYGKYHPDLIVIYYITLIVVIPLTIIMEKRCIKFILNLMNSDIILFDRTVKHSLSMSSTTLGENIRYFMFKYIYMSEWYGPLSVFYGKIQKQHIKRNIFCQ